MTVAIHTLSLSWPATVGAFLALGLLGLLIARLWGNRTRRLLDQRNELSLAIMLKTREIRKEKAIVDQQKKQIELLLETAQRTNRLKDEFLTNISHELRTPLHGVIGMTGLTLNTDLNAEQREYLQIAQSSANSLLSLLNEVLDFSHIQAGHLVIENISFDLRECIAKAIHNHADDAREKKLCFQLQIDASIPNRLEGDPGRIGQIVSNLLSNAVKFTEEGSIRLSVARHEDAIAFRVEDTGIGIALDKQEEIFEPFHQADGSSTRKYGGTGLGLCICKRVATKMGGTLTVESELGCGTVFTFRLPVAPGLQTVTPSQKADELSQPGVTVKR